MNLGYVTNQLPTQKVIQKPLVLELYRLGGSANPESIYSALTKYFNLIDEVRYQKIGQSEENKFENDVRWARQQLLEKGILKNESPRGIWELSEVSMEVLNNFDFTTLKNDLSKMVIETEEYTKISQKELDELIILQKRIGEIGEEIVLKHEQEILKANGLNNLANKVKRVSIENCREGYDILSYSLTGIEKYIEVKSSTKNYDSFYISENELKYAKNNIEGYYLYLVKGIDVDEHTYADITIIDDFQDCLENNQVELTPVKWKAKMKK